MVKVNTSQQILKNLAKLKEVAQSATFKSEFQILTWPND